MTHSDHDQDFGRALAAAKEMAARHERGDFNPARDLQQRDDIDGWVGFKADGGMRWPRAICEAAQLGPRDRAWPKDPRA